jgi:signal transduction histidine kinase
MTARSATLPPDSPPHPGLTDALHQGLSAGVIVLGEHRQIQCCTPEAERLLGLPPGQLPGCDLSALPAPIEKLAREAFTTGRAVAPRTLALATGREAPVFRIAAIPFASATGATQVVVTVQDVVVVRRLEQSLHRLDRLASLGTLSASLAHEIRNAFVAVRTFVDLLLENNRDAELAEVVTREMRRIDSIVSQMLKFGAPGRPAFAPVRVHELLDHSLRMLQHQFDSKLIALHRNFAAAHDAIKGDDYQLEQAFVNLFFNALEAMGPNGRLSVATELSRPQPAAPPFVRVTVTDNGIGIPPENMRRLFEPFFTTKQNGTGLGLAITQRIVREHHGDITAASEPGKGTTFHVLLPVHGEIPPPTLDAPPGQEP